MTLAEALEALASGSSDEAGLVLWDELKRLARGSNRIVPRFREQAVDDALMIILKKVRIPGFLATVANPEAYCRTIVANRSIDLKRKEDRELRHSLSAPKPVAPDDPGDDAPDLLRLHELFKKARSRRQERYRPHLDQAWDDLLGVLQGSSIAEILEGRGEAATSAALNRAYKSQERLRKALVDVIEYKRALGSWSDDDCSIYEAEIRLLIRCQGRGHSHVYDHGGDHDR